MLKKLEKKLYTNTIMIENDISYFKYHYNRYERFYKFLENHFKENSKNINVLDIGSHYLHISSLLSIMEFNVYSLDVSEFWNLNFVKNRSQKFNLKPIVENDLSKLESMKKIENKYDLIVFSEILEHITFNPINFWKTVHRIIKPGGLIYISTPNAFSLVNFFRKFKNMIFLKSIGIPVDQIMSNVTYGHHWKEYSISEIRSYFKYLSDDFDVLINSYSYRTYSIKSTNFIYNILSIIGNKTLKFSDDLEVIVTVKEKNNWKLDNKEY